MGRCEYDHVLLRRGIDRIFESVSHRQRLVVLVLLKQGRLDTMADVPSHGAPETAEPEIALVHTHLPKLAEAGYIEWDRETDAISTGPHFEEIEPLLELFDTHADELPPDWP